MAMLFVLHRIKALLLSLFGVVKRAMCCFRRRRRLSGDPIPLTAVGVIPNDFGTEPSNVPEFQNWNSWDENPESVVSDKVQNNAVQQQIEMYRQKTNQSQKEETEQQLDFFQDMAPKITKQPKIVLKTEAETRWNDSVSPRLALEVDSIVFPTAELETWEEGSGWEDQTQDEWDPGNALREKRRQERQRRALELQQKKQQQQRTSGLGLRLAS